MRLAFFGGSFDPPHLGHLGVALAAAASGRTDRVLLAPAYLPPHKAGRRRAPYADRLEMVRLLAGSRPALEPCDIEGRLRLVPSYTFDVLEALSRERPGNRIQLLIGGDSLMTLHEWYRAGELAERYEILTYPRPGFAPSEAALSRFWPAETVRKLLAGILPGSFFEISSTNVRISMAKARKMEHINHEVPEVIEEYIRRRHLYEEEEGVERS